jgi:uncharacterized protein involved in outer membrane biogenesis
MLTDPVLAALLLFTLDSDATSYDAASVVVPARPPAVTDTRSVPYTPPALRHRTLESDSQPSVVSHAVPPTRADPV